MGAHRGRAGRSNCQAQRFAATQDGASLEPAEELSPEQLEAFAKLVKTFKGATIRKDYQTTISVPKTHAELIDAAKSDWCSAEYARRTEAEKNTGAELVECD